ncbi:hypothetical protein B0H10DRAFT_1955964 [Mycena sp. CBHHK59/15]|nr:hypothetical protein B0H10DRAFT_1955964 [Mycena sp. CBHHK59/15]
MCASTDAMFAPAPNILKHRGHVEVSSQRSAACSTVLGVEEGRKLVVQLVQREIGGRMREHSAAQNEPVVGAESPTRRGCGQWRTIVDREKRNTCSFPIWGGLAISVSDREIRHPLLYTGSTYSKQILWMFGSNGHGHDEVRCVAQIPTGHGHGEVRCLQKIVTY